MTEYVEGALPFWEKRRGWGPCMEWQLRHAVATKKRSRNHLDEYMRRQRVIQEARMQGLKGKT
jgi:hypothetical protein